MKKLAIVSVLISFIGLSGFLSVSTGAPEKEERSVTGFSKIDLAIPGKLYYTQGSSFKVVIDASNDDLDIIDTEVQDETLKIKTKNCWACNLSNVKIYVTSPDMHGLRISGSGSIYAENDIQTNDMDLKISGSGKIILEGLQARKVYAAISGSGDIDIEKGGNVEELEAKISGSGNIDVENVQTNDIHAKISGSGSCKVHAVDKITAKISGSGNIYYHGRPRMDVVSSGSGKVKAL